MKSYCCLLLCCASFCLGAQDLHMQWVKTVGGFGNDYGLDIAVDKSGNIYMAGQFASQAQFVPGSGASTITSNGHFDIYIAKLDASGNLIWIKSIGGARADGPWSIAVDSKGNVYYSAWCDAGDGPVDLDPGPGTFFTNQTGGFISKLDRDGNFVWAQVFGTSVNIPSIALDATDHLYASGGFSSTRDFDPGPGTFILTPFGGQQGGISDGFVLKLDENGKFNWAKQFGGTGMDVAVDLALDQNGNLYLTGSFNGVADLDPGPGTVSFTGVLSDIFVLKLDPSGNYLWAKTIGSTSSDLSQAIEVDHVGSVFVGGTFAFPLDFDPGPGVYTLTPQADEAYVFKLDKDGNFLWARSMGGPSQDRVKALTVDGDGSVYTTGEFMGTADFDPSASVYNLTSNGYGDIFISKLDNNGNFVWAIDLGSSMLDDFGYAIKVDEGRNVYSAGIFWGTVDFDPEATTYNVKMVDNGDAFIHKMSQCLSVSYDTLTATSCGSYTLNSMVYTQSGQYTQRLTNHAGCDSILTLKLTVGGEITTADTITACDSYSWQSQTLTTSGDYAFRTSSVSGCDSIVQLHLTIKHRIHTSVDTAVCEGQNYFGYTVPNTYVDTFALSGGCDSIRTLHLGIKPKAASKIKASICEGESYLGYSKSGTYQDRFSGVNGCDSIRVLELTVIPQKQSTVEVSICEGERYFAGGTYQSRTGIYHDTLHTSTGCDSLVTTHLLVHPLPKPSLGVDKNLCEGSPLLLEPGVFSSYQWMDGSTSPQYLVTATGFYWVKVWDRFNCSSMDTIQIIKAVTPPSNFLNPRDSVCAGERLEIAPKEPFYRYLWSTGSSAPILSIEQAGEYTLTVWDLNGCMGRDTISVLPKQCYDGVAIPSAFTPNGDGLNDLFRARVPANLVSFRLEVYNRYGEIVFMTTDPKKGWNGLVKGKIFSSTVFIWQCFYQLQGQTPGYQKGTVLLVR